MYLSDIVGLPVRDSAGADLARVLDLIIRPDFVEPYPAVTGLVARLRRRAFFIPWEQVAALGPDGVTLASARVSLEPFRRREGEVLLARDVLDKQLVDVEGRRVVRANDLQFALGDGAPRVVAVDVSPRAIVRRLLPRAVRRSSRPSDLRSMIDFADLESFAGQLPTVKLKVPHDRLARLHPVDIARIVDSLSYHQGAELVDALDLETAADTLEEMSPDRQADILEGMDEERAADILEEMEPDEAADLLAELDEDKAESLLDKMEPEYAEDVRDLMRYEGDSAGGIMTTEVVMVPVELRAGEALRYIREQIEWVPEFVPYVYVVDSVSERRLLGVTTLRDLVLADPAAELSEVMDATLHTVQPDDDAESAARIMEEYYLLALPVVDAAGRLLGIVTIDDAIDVLHPDSGRRRLFRVFG